MKITIEFNIDNAAFRMNDESLDHGAVAETIREVARKVQTYGSNTTAHNQNTPRARPSTRRT